MNTLHLKYALEVEKTGSITKAADKLYMNQPHLSKTIRELEDTLGAEIFRRTSKGMIPTKKGTEFLSYARNILAQLERMENLFSPDGKPMVSLSVSVPRASYISYAFTEFIRSLGSDGDIDVDYRETNSMTSIGNVVDGESDIGIIRCRSDFTSYFTNLISERNLRFELVREFEYLALMSSGHPLARETAVSASKLCEYIEITHGDSASSPMPRHGAREPSPDAHRREIAIYERGSQFEILKRIPSTYMWVSPVPDEVLETFSLVQKRLEAPGPLHRDYLIYRNDYRFTREDRGFIEKLGEILKNAAAV